MNCDDSLNNYKVSGNYQEKVKLLITILWIATIFFVALCLWCLPKYYAVFPLFISIILIPIVKWQRLLKKVFIRKWVKPAILIFLLWSFFFCFFFSNTEKRNNPSNIEFPKTFSLVDSKTLEVFFLDVGEGDAALVTCDGHSMLIDGGSASESSYIYSYLKKHEINHLDYIVCSHPHEDHVGGLAGALNFATVEKAYCSSVEYDSRAFQSFLKYLEKQNIVLLVPEVGESFTLGAAVISVLGPKKSDPVNLNNESIILKIQFGNTSFLFTGDAEMPEEFDLISSGFDLQCNVLKVAHHGSNTSSSMGFLKKVQPDIAVISVGKNNSYGHPSKNVLNDLQLLGSTIYRTDLNGEITCISDGSHIEVKKEK